MDLQRSINRRSMYSPLICQICGDIARGMNFDVITCMSCKAFFRRHALRAGKNLRCMMENDCIINKQTRGLCGACRLRKCFAFGMNPNLIRSVDNQSVKASTSNGLPPPQPLNLLNHDQSLLTIDEWNLLSNIIHAYDEQNLVVRTQCSLKEQSSLPIKIRSKQINTLQLVGSFYVAMQPFIERSPWFFNLPHETRRTIIQNNLSGLGSFNAVIATIEANLFDEDMYMNNCKEIYGKDYVDENFRIVSKFESNRTLFKVFLMILTFSTNCSIISYEQAFQWIPLSNFHSYHLNQIQNTFVTMLWKYLVYQYGHAGAVRCFVRVVKNYLDLLLRVHANHSVQHWQMVDTIVEKSTFSSIHNY